MTAVVAEQMLGQSWLDQWSSLRIVHCFERAYASVQEFYFQEAELLDDNQFASWLDLLDPGLRYQVPVRETRLRSVADSSDVENSTYFTDSYASIVTRVRRLTESSAAWAEDPPSRSRRIVSNLRVRTRHSNLAAAEFFGRSNLLIIRNRGDDTDFELLSAERRDLLTESDRGSLLLKSRCAILDQRVIGNANLALFL